MNAGIEGTVTVAFTVEKDGRVTDLDVMNSTSRQLNPFALKTVSAWKFAAGSKDGKAASFRLRTPIEFSLKSDLSRAAEDTRSQTEVTVVAPPAKRKVTPVYPYEMIVEGKSGWADANFLIDYSGRPLFTSPGGFSDDAFGKAVVAMIEASEFVPNRRDKRPVMTPALEHYRFEGEVGLDADAKRVLAELRKPNPEICSSGDLDQRPKALRQDAPVYPRALKDDGLTGEAEIEFIVARDGRVLFPRIVSATHEDFGWAAATAVGQWRFAPPQRNGQAVETRMKVPILFDAHKLASSD